MYAKNTRQLPINHHMELGKDGTAIYTGNAALLHKKKTLCLYGDLNYDEI